MNNKPNMKKPDEGTVIEVNTQEEWDRLLKHTGLVVAEFYQKWQGPCMPIMKLFTKLQMQINDDRIQFAHVVIDKIGSLELYKGRCEPAFLLYGGGNLVGVLRGVDAPGLKQLILTKYEEELRVLKGEIQRTVVKDTGIRNIPNPQEDFSEETYEFNSVELTLCIIKPDIVANDQSEVLIQAILDHGFEIVRREMKKLTVDEIKQVYRNIMKEDYSDEIIEYMSTGLSCLVVLLSPDTNPVSKLKEIIGNKDVEQARKEEPASLRALFGTSGYRNGLHCSGTKEEALRSISLFFPELVVRKGDEYEKEKECVIVAFPTYTYENKTNYLINHFKENGFRFEQMGMTTISKVDIYYLYNSMTKENNDLLHCLDDMSKSEFMILALTRKNSVKTAQYILNLYDSEDLEEFNVSKLKEDMTTLIYCSYDKASALRDYKFFFPIEVTLGIIKPDAFEMKEEIMQIIRLNDFLIPISMDVILTHEFIEILYQTIKDTSFFRAVSNHMTSGPCVIMVLSKHDAIEEWRSLMGPTDPDEAFNLGPDKLRGIFGTTLMHNALHGSANKKEAMSTIRAIFGNIQFDHLGNICGKLEDDNLTYPTRIYRPLSIDETQISDILEKCSLGNEISPSIRTQDLSRNQIAELYASIPSSESHTNVKCFIEIVNNVIPVLHNEEKTALEQLEYFNVFPNTKKSTKVRKSGWLKIFQNLLVEPEISYVVYDFNPIKTPVIPFKKRDKKVEGLLVPKETVSYTISMRQKNESGEVRKLTKSNNNIQDSSTLPNAPAQSTATSSFTMLNLDLIENDSLKGLDDDHVSNH